MKKYFLILLAAAAALVSCNKDNNVTPGNDNGESTPIVFNLTAHHPDQTRAVKTGWENGDAIFVFFSNVAAPKHLKMVFDGTAWTYTEYDGATPTPGALGLGEGATGKMRAIFLPFGSDATVSASGEDFVFSKTYYTYYLTAELYYTVTSGKIEGTFYMTIPDNYVQFYVADASATDEAYTLGCDAVIPTGLASVSANCSTLTETSDKVFSDDLPGYAYNGGYLFSGKLNNSYVAPGSYYFAKTKVSDGSRCDYFVTSKTLASHSAVNLPANDNIYTVTAGTPNSGKWIPVGSGITTGLFKAGEPLTSLGTWYTCNDDDQTVPEGRGSMYLFSSAISKGLTLPTKEQWEAMLDNCSWTWASIHGTEGFAVKADSGFLFLPSNYSGSVQLDYWSSTPEDASESYMLYSDNHPSYPSRFVGTTPNTHTCLIRAVL